MSDPANTKIYRNILVALLILTAVTVGISRVPLGAAGNIALGLAVAVLKASLVVAFFMHLKYEHRSWLGIVLFPLLLVMIILFSNLPDTGMNGPDTKNEWGQTTPAVKEIKHHGKPGHK